MPDSQLKPRSFTERVEPVQWRKQREPDEDEAREAFKESSTRVWDSPMLQVRMANGRIEWFAYTDLRRVSYLPADTLILHFNFDQIKVEGRNLERLGTAIGERRARFVQEGTEEEERFKPEEEPHISSIEITERETI